MESFDPFHLIDPLFQQSNEMLDPSNDDLNLEETKCLATNYDESSSDERDIVETGEHIRSMFNVFED